MSMESELLERARAALKAELRLDSLRLIWLGLDSEGR